MDKINRVVVRGTNWVGDAVMTIPALRELRRLLPEAHITLATSSWAQELFSEADYLDDLLIQNNRGFWSVFKNSAQWRKRNFDLAVIFPNSFASALLPALDRVPLRIGYASDSRKVLLTHAVPLPEWRSSRHEIFYYLNIISELQRVLGVEVITQEPDISIQISEASQKSGRDLLQASGCDDVHPVIALCPGSINSRAKRWPAERYATLADYLIERLQAQVVLMGSEAEVDISSAVKRQMRNQPVTLTGKTNLGQSVAVLSNIDLLITNDTGPAHIASSLGRPTLVIFGPTNPLTTRPYSSTGEIVRHPPDCAPCMLRDCPIDHRCMTAISPEEVFERACVLLSDKLQFVAPQNSDNLKFVGQGQ